MRMFGLGCWILSGVLLASSAEAVAIQYQVTPVTGSTWRYEYTVVNDGALTSDLRLFDILFDPALFDEDSLAIVSDPAIVLAWDELVLPSGLLIPAAYDVLARAGGIGAGQSVSGFAVTFVWLGAGTPGAQEFEIYDADTFEVIGGGTTTPVPEPSAAVLLAVMLLWAGMTARSRWES